MSNALDILTGTLVTFTVGRNTRMCNIVINLIFLDNKKLLSKTAERSPSGDNLYLEVLRPVTVLIDRRMARLRFTGHYARFMFLANFYK